jgi:choice-of-anchor B domain-containing protein
MKMWPGSTWAVAAALAAGLTVNAEARPPEPAGKPEADTPFDPSRFAYRHTPDPDALPQLEPLGSTACVGGMAGPYPCKDVDLMSFLPLSTIGGGQNGSSLWGWTDPDTNREYAIMGRDNGTAFVDITDAANPIYKGNLPTHTGSSIWREMKTYGYYAYIISDGNGPHGMQIFDMRHLRTPITTPKLKEDGWYGGFQNCHDLVINTDTGFAYCVGSNTCSGGLHMMNLANPLVPQFVGCFSADGYTHDAQCVIYNGPDTAHVGKEICFASNEDTLTIVDVTNKSVPVMLSETGYSGSGYTHQGWLTADHNHFVVDDELDELDFGHPTWTYIWNVGNLDAPFLMGHYVGPTNAIDHNQYIHQGYLYQANYRAGLRILSTADIAAGSLSEVAYFDIYPSSNSPSFNGAWNNYPFFASGNVIVSGMEQGLFVLRPNLPSGFTLASAKEVVAACVAGSDATKLTLAGLNGYTGSVTLSAAGVPAGAGAGFSANPASVPGTTELTVTASGAASGAYPFTVTASDGTYTQQRDLTLHVADAAPAEPALTSPPNGAFNLPSAPVFTWDAAAQGATYDIQITTDPGFGTVVGEATGVITTTFTPVSSLANDTTHYWRVRAVNGCGPGDWSAVSSFTTTSPAGVCPLGTLATMLASERFETGAPGWTTGGTGTTWGPSNAQAHTGALSYLAAAPEVVTDQRLISPLVALPTGQAPLSMQFWNYQVLEAQGTEHTLGCWDGAVVEISTDDGATWAQLPATVLLTDPYHGLVAGTQGNPLADLSVWCGSPQPWLNSVVDIGSYAGQTVRFRFRLGTDAGVGSEGWYVDDYLVQSCVAQVPNVTIDDPSVGEKHEEQADHPSAAYFTVTLSAPAAQTVTASYQTRDGTATADLDYVPTSGTLTIPAGSVTGTVHVTIIDDSLQEPDETFFLKISNVIGGTVIKARGQATILDDDLAP